MELNEFLEKIEFRFINWDDYGYKLTAELTYEGKAFDIKILPNDGENYERIKANSIAEYKIYFWGLGRKYYEFIKETLSEDAMRDWYELTGDIAYFKEKSLEKLKERDYIFENSFFRNSTYQDAVVLIEQCHRLAVGENFLSNYKFKVIKDDEEILNVDIKPANNISLEMPDSEEWSIQERKIQNSISDNVYCLIGGNGTGKTTFLENLALAFLGGESKFEINYEHDGIVGEDVNEINKVIYITYSPFDKDMDYIEKKYTKKFNEDIWDIEEKFKILGIKNLPNGEIDKKLLDNILELKNSNENEKKETWLNSLESISFEDWSLEMILLFKNGFEKKREVIGGEKNDRYIYINREVVQDKIKKLSSGQKIFLLTLTDLCLVLRERMVVLFDEPELFLHPPLIKAQIRILNYIMNKNNSIAFLVTHSPITLQEIPHTCVLVTSRERDGKYSIKQMKQRTFGESISVISDAIFNVNLHKTGYYNLISELKYDKNSSQKLNKLRKIAGSEAKLLIDIYESDRKL